MNILDVIIGGLVAILLIVLVGQHMEIKSLDSDISTYQQQINMLKIESQKQAEEAQASYETAQYQMRRIQDNSKKIMLAKVPKDCAGSVKWLAQQAQSL